MNSEWLLTTPHWDADKENVIFIHGYAAGDGSTPTLMMRDAFIQSGLYNFFMIDYGPVSRAPCYVSLVQNIKYVSNCVASYLKNFMDSGMQKQSITCTPHILISVQCFFFRTHSLADQPSYKSFLFCFAFFSSLFRFCLIKLKASATAWERMGNLNVIHMYAHIH